MEIIETRSYWKLYIIAVVSIIIVFALAYAFLTVTSFTPISWLKHSMHLTGTARGIILENYPVMPFAKNVRVSLGEKVVRTKADGTFEIGDLPIGMYNVKLEGNGYETAVKTIYISLRNENKRLSINVNSVEAARRWMKTKQLNQYSATYTLLHPDEQARINIRNYVASKKQFQKKYSVQIKDFRVAYVKTFRHWRQPVSGLSYDNVAMLRIRSMITAKKAGTGYKTVNVYAQKVNNLWMFLTSE